MCSQTTESSNKELKQFNVFQPHQLMFGIHGGGSIGLGLMADIVSKSPLKYNIVATTNDKFITDLINISNRYTLRHKTNGNSISTTLIDRIKIISRNTADIINLYKQADIAAICLTPGVMKATANDIALGLIERYRERNLQLKIFVLMNTPRNDQFVRNKIKSALLFLINDQYETKKILDQIQFIPTVADRIVTKMDATCIKSSLKKQLQVHYSKINKIKREIKINLILSSQIRLAQAVKKFNLEVSLFNAEHHFVLYIPSNCIDKKQFPTIKQTTNLVQLDAVKNKFINGPHAIIAWIGALFGCKTIAEAIRLPKFKNYIKEMMAYEIRPALKKEFPDLTDKELAYIRRLFIRRCMDSIDDPVTRVGRDPLRKINSNGRIRGTIELCKKHGLKNSTIKLEQGLAAAILYATKEVDRNNLGCLEIIDLYNRYDRDYRSVLCYQGETSSGSFRGFHPIRDKSIIDKIVSHIHFMEKKFKKMEENRKLQMSLRSAANKNITSERKPWLRNATM